MSRNCPLMGTALYIDCLECDYYSCIHCKNKKQYKYQKLIIGIDQSYKNTGISLSGDNKLLKVKSVNLEKYQTNSEKRKVLSESLDKLLKSIEPKSKEIICIIERIRLRSKGFLNIDYIKSIGALNSIIVDKCSEYNIKVYSVDTRCWKSQVIGTSKPQSNKYGVPDEKWATVQWVINQGFESSILQKVEGRKTKGTFTKDGQKYMYNNDAADSAGISMFGFIGDKSKLKIEK